MIGTRMFGHARGDEARKRWPVDFALGVLVAKFNIYIYIYVYCIVSYCIHICHHVAVTVKGGRF